MAAAITTLGMSPHFDGYTEGAAAQLLRWLAQEREPDAEFHVEG